MSGVVLCGWRGRGWWLENCLVGGGVKCVGECRREGILRMNWILVIVGDGWMWLLDFSFGVLGVGFCEFGFRSGFGSVCARDCVVRFEWRVCECCWKDLVIGGGHGGVMLCY